MRTSCGAPMAFGCSRWTTADGSSPPSRWNAESGWHVWRGDCRPAADLHGACRAVWLDRGRRGSGAGLADGSRRSICRTTSPTRSSSGASSRPTPSSPSPRPTASPTVQSHAEGTIPWSHLATSRSCGTPSATSSNSTMPSGSSKRTARARSSAWHPRSRRVRPCVQGTGCAQVDIDAHRVYSAPTDRSTGIICDQTISLDGFYTRQDYPELLRRIRFKDPESGKTLVFITNNFSLPAATICALYKSRWQVELFFKWIKQPQGGTPENAVKTQSGLPIVKKRLDLRLALHFVTVTTPDAHTSSTCGRRKQCASQITNQLNLRFLTGH